MSVHAHIVTACRVFGSPPMGDPTIAHLPVWWRRDGPDAPLVRATVVRLHDDAFERGWSWPRGAFRYAVRAEGDGDGGGVEPVTPYCDARTLFLSTRS